MSNLLDELRGFYFIKRTHWVHDFLKETKFLEEIYRESEAISFLQSFSETTKDSSGSYFPLTHKAKLVLEDSVMLFELIPVKDAPEEVRKREEEFLNFIKES